MTVANYFTFLRLLISPIFLTVYVSPETFGLTPFYLPYFLLLLLLISEFSDAFDGFIARKMSQVTDLGKILDPMADSISRTSVFLTFTQAPVNLPIFFIFIFLCRDLSMSTLRTVHALKGQALAASRVGKMKAIIQAFSSFAVLFLMILNVHGVISKENLQVFSFWIILLAAIYTVYAFIDYVLEARKSFSSPHLSSTLP